MRVAQQLKLSVELPDEWADALKQVAARAGYRSTSEYVRQLIAADPALSVLSLPPLSKTWGKRTVAQLTSTVAQQSPDKPPELRNSTQNGVTVAQQLIKDAQLKADPGSTVAQVKGEMRNSKTGDAQLKSKMAQPSGLSSAEILERARQRREQQNGKD